MRALAAHREILFERLRIEPHSSQPNVLIGKSNIGKCERGKRERTLLPFAAANLTSSRLKISADASTCFVGIADAPGGERGIVLE